MRSITIILFLLAMSSGIHAQWKKFVGLETDFGFCAIRNTNEPPDAWRPGVCTAFHPRIGFAWVKKDRLQIGVTAGLPINTIRFFRPDTGYVVSYFYRSTMARISYMWPLKKELGTFIHFGVMGGVKWYDEDVIDLYIGSTRLYGFNPRTQQAVLSAQLGITKLENKHRVAISLCYFYHASPKPSHSFELTDVGFNYKSKATGNYLGGSVAFYWRVGKEKQIQVKPATLPENPHGALARETSTIQSIRSRKRMVTVVLYESGNVDNDTISVIFNGRYVLRDHELTSKKRKIRLPLEDGENTIVLVAENEGNIPPNTASCRLKWGWFHRRTFAVSTSKKKNASIRIEKR